MNKLSMKFKTLNLLATLCASTLAYGNPIPTINGGKPNPTGIIDLPGAVSAQTPIGGIGDHPWQNPNVDALRIRMGWVDIETADGVFNWVQLDQCIANAATVGKFIGLSLVSGLGAPPWLMGGVTFADGSTTVNSATLTSPTANFVTADVGRVIVCSNFPPGATIRSRTTSTSVVLSASANKTKTGNVTFSILARNPGGAQFRNLTPPSMGVMPVPWDPIFKAQWKAFIVALAARYDHSPQLGYLSMTGFCQGGEAYLAGVQADIDFFNASAIAAGYNGTPELPAGLVAWEAVVKEMVDQYMISFPNTPLFITAARPYPDLLTPSLQGGTTAMNDIFAWGVANHPGRFGIMNAQLHVTSTLGYFLNAAIYANHLTEPVGIQFLCNSGPDNIARLCNAPPYGDGPLLRPYNAMNASFTAGVSFGCNFIEVYEYDVTNPAYQTMLAIQRAALQRN